MKCLLLPKVLYVFHWRVFEYQNSRNNEGVIKVEIDEDFRKRATSVALEVFIAH